MNKKLTVFVIFLLIFSINIINGKDANKTTSFKTIYKKQANTKMKIINDRIKRSLHENEDNPPWSNKAFKTIPESLGYDNEFKNKMSSNVFRNLEIEPFWATRGRRDSSSDEDYSDAEYAELPSHEAQNIDCKNCYTPMLSNYRNIKVSRDEYSPFWGNRGRRSSDENDIPAVVFWGSRGRREDNKPFWGNRGRRKDDLPFWGNRGRREEEPFWGNRGRRQSKSGRNQVNSYEDEPFWGNRGRREDTEPFWGNRGRREDSGPFWGNRGRREDSEPFWGNRGRRRNAEPFWGNRGRRKEELKKSILTAMENVENDIENLSRLRRTKDTEINPLLANRESMLKMLPNLPVKSKMILAPNSETVHDSRIYAEQPRYILVERSSRSSAEEDPFFISRGKKYYLNYSLIKAARDRRGAIEEIVKSVRNDPYYIARGKKRRENIKPGNATQHEEIKKVKELVCAAVDLIMINNQNTKVKREINDNERDRRQILKKLAAQLQIDPYYASRGKKNDENTDRDHLYDFINDVADKCDY